MELFTMIADSVTNGFKGNNCTVASTKQEAVVCDKMIDTDKITPCYNEEADDISTCPRVIGQ